MIIRKIETTRIPYLVADLVGASASAALFGVICLFRWESLWCGSYPSRFEYDLAFVILSFLSYITITIVVWSIHRELPLQLLSGRLNWMLIAFVGLFVSSTIWAILDSYQCPVSISVSLHRAYWGAIHTSPVFLSVFLFPCIVALLVEFMIRRVRGSRLS